MTDEVKMPRKRILRTWLATLSALWPASIGLAQDPADQYRVLAQQAAAADTAYQDKRRAVFDAYGFEAMRKLGADNPRRGFIAQFREAAKKHAGKPDAVRFLTWLLTADQRPINETAQAALATLLSEHLQHAEIEAVAAELAHDFGYVGKDRAVQALRKIQEATPHERCRATAMYALAVISLQEDVRLRRPTVALAQIKQAVAMASGAPWERRANGYVFELERLQVGMKVPEIVGTDFLGTAFKLSDYESKVVVLNFWNSRSGPSRNMLMQRNLARRYANGPFSLIGINTDENIEVAKAILEKKGAVWRNLYDGKDGPIASTWNVQGWPMMFVIDHLGVIRGKGRIIDDKRVVALVNRAQSARRQRQ